MRIKSFIKNVFFRKAANVFLSNWTIFIVEFFIGVLVVHYFGSKGKGQFSALIALVGVLAAMLSLGLNSSKVYFENKNKFSNKKSFSIQFFYQLLLTCVLIPVFFVFRKDIVDFIEVDVNHLLLLFCFVIILINTQIFSLFLNTGYLGSGNVNQYSKLRISLVVIKLVSIISCICIGMDIIYSIILIAAFETFLILYLVFSEKLNRISISLITAIEIKEYFIFGIKANTITVINSLIKRFDFFIITSTLGISILGKYSVALIFFTLIISIPQAIHGLLFGELTKKDQTKKQILKLFTIICLLSLCLGLILATLMQPFILYFYGVPFIEIVPVAKILILAAMIQGGSGVFKVSIMSKNKSHFIIYEQIISGIFQIMFMIILIERYGLMGVAYAILIGSLISLILRYAFYEKN